MIQAESNLFAQYDPLNITKSMRIEGGTTKQVYYADSSTYMPNRELTPLVLQPVIIVSDPDGIIPTGDKAGKLSVARWYTGSTDARNLITSQDTDYTLGANGSLIVNRNVPQDSPVQLIFEGEFYDTRRMSSIHIDMTVQITTTSNAESITAPVLTIDRPRGWIYNPLKDTGNQSVSCQLFRQGEAVSDTNARYWWYVMEADKERLVGSDELDLFYVSGQNTKTLTIDPQYLKRKIFRCKAEYVEGEFPASPGKDSVRIDTKFKRKYPRSLYLKVNVRTGERVLPSTSIIQAEAVMGTKNGVISNPDKYFHIRWFRNTMLSGATDVEIGRGSTLSVDRATLGLGVTERPRLFVKAEEHDPYRVLTDKEGNLLTDKDGNLLVGF